MNESTEKVVAESASGILREIVDLLKERVQGKGGILTAISLAILALWVFHRTTAEDLIARIWGETRIGGNYTIGVATRAARRLTGSALYGYDATTIRLGQFFTPIRMARWRANVIAYVVITCGMLLWGIFAHGNYQISNYWQNVGNTLFVIALVLILTPLALILWIMNKVFGNNQTTEATS